MEVGLPRILDWSFKSANTGQSIVNYFPATKLVRMCKRDVDGKDSPRAPQESIGIGENLMYLQINSPRLGYTDCLVPHLTFSRVMVILSLINLTTMSALWCGETFHG